MRRQLPILPTLPRRSLEVLLLLLVRLSFVVLCALERSLVRATSAVGWRKEGFESLREVVEGDGERGEVKGSGGLGSVLP
jgi:hypothetical protein